MDPKIIKQLEGLLQKALVNVATKDDLKNFATKKDLEELKHDLVEEIKESEGFIVASVDKNKSDKADVEDLQRQVTKLERRIAE